MALHGVEFVGNIERVHCLFAGAFGVGVDHAHDGIDAFVERRVWRVGHELVVFEEIDAGLDEGFNELGGLRDRESDAGLDDGADERTALDAGELAATRDAEFRSTEVFGK